jgi:hypothetical protein
MKILLITLTALFVSQVHASYFATRCSNASASIKWESGHNSNSLTVRYYADVEKEEVITLNMVDIQEGKRVVLKEESVCRNGMFSRTKVYAMSVNIKADENFPNALDFYGQKAIKTEVICKHHMNGRSPCQ